MYNIKVKVHKTIYYYLILFGILLFSFSFIPIVYEVVQQKITSNIPYLSLICLIISYLIFILITIIRGYNIHLFFYLVGLIPIIIILFFKSKYDLTNIIVNKKNNIIRINK